MQVLSNGGTGPGSLGSVSCRNGVTTRFFQQKKEHELVLGLRQPRFGNERPNGKALTSCLPSLLPSPTFILPHSQS